MMEGDSFIQQTEEVPGTGLDTAQLQPANMMCGFERS